MTSFEFLGVTALVAFQLAVVGGVVWLAVRLAQRRRGDGAPSD